MGFYDIAYSSVRGNLHKLKELPNQDAVDIREVNDVLVVSIADGHGSRTCFRSDIGSKMAVETANVLVADMLLKDMSQMKRFGEEAESLCRRISAMWSKTVLAHLGKNAFEDGEVEKLDKIKQRELGRNALLAYGTTLMTLVVSKERTYVLNIGDCELLIKYNDRETPEILNRNRTLGNETESLALRNAHKYYTVHEMDSGEIEALLAATDGYPNSFKDDTGFLKVIDDLIQINDKHGIDAIKENMSAWLEDTSLKGSGDDITACFVIKKEII